MYLTTLAFKFSTAIPYHLRKCYVLVNEVKFTYDYLHSRSLNKWMSLLCLPAEFSFPVKCRIAHLRQRCHNPKFVIFQEKILKILKCYNFLWVQRQHSCSPAASFANCIMTIYLLKVHLQTFLSIPITQKCQVFEAWHSWCKWAIYSCVHQKHNWVNFMVTTCINNIQHFNFQLIYPHSAQYTHLTGHNMQP